MSYLNAVKEVEAAEAAEAAVAMADPRGQIEAAKQTIKEANSTKTKIRILIEVAGIPSQITREIDVHIRIVVVHEGRAPLVSLSL